MTSNDRHHAAEAAARRRGGLHRADGDRRVGQAIRARRGLAPRRDARARLGGREVSGQDRRFAYLAVSHD